MQPSVAIILVNYNGYSNTVECVKSLKNLTYSNYSIYIVNNGSLDAEEIRKDEFLNSTATILYSIENLGFSGANNLAIKDILSHDYKYVLLLNNDTIVEPDFLNEMVSVAEQDSTTGVVTGKIFSYYNKNFVWSAGGEFDRHTGLADLYCGPDCDELNYVKKITFATGCLMLMPSQVVTDIGPMDECYFMYSEDTDYCQRVLDAGYNLIYTPAAVIYHKISASAGDKSRLQQRYMMRNNLYMIKKYSTDHFYSYLCITWRMFKHIVRGRRNLIPTLMGYFDFLRHKTGEIKKTGEAK